MANLDYTGAVLALDRLLDELPYESSYTIDRLSKIGALPSADMYELQPRLASEELALTPLLYLGQELEQSQCSLKQVADWYSGVVSGINRIAKTGHSKECYDYDNGSAAHTMCQNSYFCPNRIMDAYLSEDIRDLRFDEQMYESDPARKHDIALLKAQIGQHHGILILKDSNDWMISYNAAFQKKFPNVFITYKPTDEITANPIHESGTQAEE